MGYKYILNISQKQYYMQVCSSQQEYSKETIVSMVLEIWLICNIAKAAAQVQPTSSTQVHRQLVNRPHT